MLLPEWAAVCILAAIGAVIWWGVLRFVHTSDEVSKSLTSIVENMSELNSRIGRAEEWRDSHDKQDDERHRDIKDVIKELLAE